MPNRLGTILVRFPENATRNDRNGRNGRKVKEHF
jgi:hypothetical protein